MDQNKLIIVQFNCNSVKNKLKEFELFLNSHKVKIALLCETFLNPTDSFYIPNYSIYRNDRIEDSKGGTAILVHASIKHELVNIPKTQCVLEATAIRIFYANETLTLISIYVPNTTNKIHFNDLSLLFRIDNKILMAGDFNAKSKDWNCSTSNTRGNDLINFTSKNLNRLKIYFPDNHTFFPGCPRFSPSTIDLCITKNFHLSEKPISLSELSSDHNPVKINLSNIQVEKTESRFYDYKKANWGMFREFMDQNINHTVEISTKTQIDTAINLLTNTTKNAMEFSIPKMRISDQETDLPQFILHKIKIKNRMRRAWQNDRTLTNVKREMYELIDEIKTDIAEHINVINERKLSRIMPKDDSLFECIKKYTKKKVKIPPLHMNNTLIVDTKEKANCIAKTFESVHSKNDGLGDVNHNNFVENTNLNYLSQNSQVNIDEVKLTSPREVSEIIKNLKNGKAPGEDKITGRIIKNFSKKSVIFFTRIINTILLLSYFPDQWKTAMVIPLPKPGKPPDSPANLRPISLLSQLSKITEKIILARIRNHIDGNSLLQKEQFGFRKNHSTTHCLLRLTNLIQKKIKEKESTSMVLLDIEKAFDTVWLNGLIFKMIEYNFPAYIIKLVHSYITSRKFIVSLENILSDTYTCSAGVPQGSCLGPVLFILYISDLPRHPKTKISIFADDTAIFCSSVNIRQATRYMQEHLDKLHNYYEKWKIKINPTKTEAILFTKRRLMDSDSPLRMKYNGTDIQVKESVKYLGIHFQQNFKFNSHVNQVKRKCGLAMKLLFNLIKKDSPLNSDNKLKIYKVFIRPILTYNIQVWNTVCKTQLNKIQVLQNKNLRMVFSVWHDPLTHKTIRNSDLHRKAKNIPTIEEFLKILLVKTFEKMKFNENLLIKEMTEINFTNLEKTSPFYKITN
jgi:Reverse transcriptase (RNA-dependent DNA polymerase)/Endonuclease-reverse transcriptase